MDKQSRVTTTDQYETMLEFMQKNGDISKIVNRVNMTSNMVLWQQLADILNAKPNGAIKDAKKWAKTWADWKFHTKSKIMTNKELTHMERLLIEFLGWDTKDDDSSYIFPGDEKVPMEFKADCTTTTGMEGLGDFECLETHAEEAADEADDKPPRKQLKSQPIRLIFPGDTPKARALTTFAQIERTKFDFDSKIKAKKSQRIDLEKKSVFFQEKRLDKLSSDIKAMERVVDQEEQNVQKKEELSRQLEATFKSMHTAFLAYMNNKRNKLCH